MPLGSWWTGHAPNKRILYLKNMNTHFLAFLLVCALASGALAQGNELQQFIRVQASVVALVHVRVIDGTGAAAAEDQTIIINGGKISAVGPAANVPVPGDAKTLDLSGYTIM